MEEAEIESGIKALLEAILNGNPSEKLTREQFERIMFGEDEEE